MKNRRTIRHITLSIALLIMGYGITSAQGWTSGSLVSAGDPGQPYLNDGNYVSGLSAFVGDQAFAVINYPATSAGFRFEKFKVDEGFNRGCSAAQAQNSHHVAREVIQFEPDKIAVIEDRIAVQSGERTLHLSAYEINLDPLACITNLWDKPILAIAGTKLFSKVVLQDGSGGFLVLATAATLSDQNIVLIQLAANGDVLWSHNYASADNEQAVSMRIAANGNIQVLKTVSNAANPGVFKAWLMTTDANGTVLSDSNVSGSGSDAATEMTQTADGNLVLIGNNLSSNGGLFLQKINSAGATIWRQDFNFPNQTIRPYGIVENAAAELALICTITNTLSAEQDGLLMKFDASGVPVWERKIGRPNRLEVITKINVTPDGGYILGGQYTFQAVNHAYIVKTDANGIVKPSRIHGNIFRDFDLECTNTAGDQPLANWNVQAFQDSTHVFYGTSDLLGNYEIECDTGDYVVTLARPNLYWEPCLLQVPVQVGYLDTAVVNFPVQAAVDCPYMLVEHGFFRARPCDTTLMTIDYCNLGTTVADNASIVVTLDTVFSFYSASVQPSTVVGNVLTFALGDVASMECGHITLHLLVDCAATIGQIACTEVHIYPDSNCLPPNPLWSGAFIRADAKVVGDQVRFRLKNTGTTPMPTALEYIIIEDAVLLRSGNYQLQPDQEMEIIEPCTGATLRLMAAQEPGAPGNSLPIAAVEGCVSSPAGPVSLGFFNQFSENDADPFLSRFCLEVLNSYDPNDKQAFPTGFGEAHHIFANTDLEYMIRFQNTGTDTAFRVVLLDTLSAYLDPRTLQAGASSHPYTMELEGNGVLRFTFPGIKLPHSAVNEPASNGFVTFRIAQKPNNPPGTLLENRAGIYFDFNLPVMTNTVFHTVHEPWLKLVDVSQPGSMPTLAIQASPNPFSEQAILSMEGVFLPAATLRLYNTDGKVTRVLSFSGNQVSIDRHDLPAGMYFFTIETNGQVLGSGRLLAN